MPYSLECMCEAIFCPDGIQIKWNFFSVSILMEEWLEIIAVAEPDCQIVDKNPSCTPTRWGLTMDNTGATPCWKDSLCRRLVVPCPVGAVCCNWSPLLLFVLFGCKKQFRFFFTQNVSIDYPGVVIFQWNNYENTIHVINRHVDIVTFLSLKLSLYWWDHSSNCVALLCSQKLETLRLRSRFFGRIRHKLDPPGHLLSAADIPVDLHNWEAGFCKRLFVRFCFLLIQTALVKVLLLRLTLNRMN